MSVTWIAIFTEWLFFDSGTLFQTGALYLLCINNFILGAYCLLLVWNILHWGRCSWCCQTVSCPRSIEPRLSNVLGRDFWQNLVLRLRFSIHFYLVYYWSILLLLIFMNQFPISHRIWFFQHFLQQVGSLRMVFKLLLARWRSQSISYRVWERWPIRKQIWSISLKSRLNHKLIVTLFFQFSW